MYSHLQELSLNGCKLSGGLVSDLLESINQSCQLRVLGLSQQSFDLHSSLSLIQLIKNTENLKNLDISYSRFFKAKAIIDLLKSCTTKHSLQYFNLSFNTVKDSSKQDFAIAIKNFIIQSKSITHFNLSACGLQGQNALIVFQSLRKSKTLQSIHYSGNELDIQTARKIRAMLESKQLKQIQVSDELYTNQNKESDLFPEIQNQNSAIRHQLSKQDKQKKYDQQFKPSTDAHFEESHIPIKDNYIFSRILGHLEIQNGQKWVERDQCWICKKWQYLLVIWSEGLCDSFFEQKPSKHLLTFEETLKIKNPLSRNIYENSSFNPRIFGNATSFEHNKLLTIDDFKERLEINNKPFQRIVVKEEEKKRIDQQTQQKFLKAKAMISLMKNLSRKQPDWTLKEESFQNLKVSNNEIKSIFLINKQWPRYFEEFYDNFEHQSLNSIDEILQLKLRPNELYFAFADYYPPSQSQFMIQSSHKKQQVYVKNFVMKQCREDIKLSYKKIKKCRINRTFSLKDSVFSQWAVDINQEYRKAFQADMKYSKIKKFIKDPNDFREIGQILLTNYSKIFEVYVYCSGRSNYPSVQWIDFTDFCHSWNIIDKNLTLATIDRLFIAVNFEGVPGGLDDNPDKELCRYEFFEIFVRMALAKYPSTMLNEYILCDPQILSWFKFRQELVWTLEVDDLLKANLSNIRKLHSSVLTVLKKNFTVEDAAEMVFKCPNLQMNSKDATLAHAYAKFLVVDEMENIDSLQLLNFGEFQEFIARLGQIKFRDPQMPLYDKIFKVLTELLKLIGASPQHPKNDDLGESESDYDEEEDYYK